MGTRSGGGRINGFVILFGSGPIIELKIIMLTVFLTFCLKSYKTCELNVKDEPCVKMSKFKYQVDCDHLIN